MISAVLSCMFTPNDVILIVYATKRYKTSLTHHRKWWIHHHRQWSWYNRHWAQSSTWNRTLSAPNTRGNYCKNTKIKSLSTEMLKPNYGCMCFGTFFIKHKDLLDLYRKCHASWWPGDARSHCISSNAGLYFLEYSDFNMALLLVMPGHQHAWYWRWNIKPILVFNEKCFNCKDFHICIEV